MCELFLFYLTFPYLPTGLCLFAPLFVCLPLCSSIIDFFCVCVFAFCSLCFYFMSSLPILMFFLYMLVLLVSVVESFCIYSFPFLLVVYCSVSMCVLFGFLFVCFWRIYPTYPSLPILILSHLNSSNSYLNLVA